MKGHLFECQAMHPFPCGLCTRGFSSQQGVANHQGLAHSAEERGTRFRCTLVLFFNVCLKSPMLD